MANYGYSFLARMRRSWRRKERWGRRGVRRVRRDGVSRKTRRVARDRGRVNLSNM